MPNPADRPAFLGVRPRLWWDEPLSVNYWAVRPQLSSALLSPSRLAGYVGYGFVCHRHRLAVCGGRVICLKPTKPGESRGRAQRGRLDASCPQWTDSTIL